LTPNHPNVTDYNKDKSLDELAQAVRPEFFICFSM